MLNFQGSCNTDLLDCVHVGVCCVEVLKFGVGGVRDADCLAQVMQGWKKVESIVAASAVLPAARLGNTPLCPFFWRWPAWQLRPLDPGKH